MIEIFPDMNDDELMRQMTILENECLFDYVEWEKEEKIEKND